MKTHDNYIRLFEFLSRQKEMGSGIWHDLRCSGGGRWNALWRFCVFLRCAPFGCDTLWVKNPKAPRKRELNWFQRNNQLLAIQQRKAVESRDRVRAGRLERWIHQGQKLRDSMSAKVAGPEVIGCLSCTQVIIIHQNLTFFNGVRIFHGSWMFLNVFDGYPLFSYVFHGMRWNIRWYKFLQPQHFIDIQLAVMPCSGPSRCIWRLEPVHCSGLAMLYSSLTQMRRFPSGWCLWCGALARSEELQPIRAQCRAAIASGWSASSCRRLAALWCTCELNGIWWEWCGFLRFNDELKLCASKCFYMFLRYS